MTVVRSRLGLALHTKPRLLAGTCRCPVVTRRHLAVLEGPLLPLAAPGRLTAPVGELKFLLGLVALVAMLWLCLAALCLGA